MFPNTSDAQFGSCSEYGVMAYESGGYCRCMSGYVMGEGVLGGSYCVSEDQACKDQYGYNARASYTGGCECRSGYVFGTNMFGDEQCVDADNVCSEKYGYGSEYDSLSGSCDCRYGYVWGDNGQCITDDQACKDQLGIHSRHTYGDQCKCSSGYIIGSNGKCSYGDTVCRSDHGIYASYDSLSNKCECDNGYTFDDDLQCVKKHNSAYFTLLDISLDGDELIIESQNDFQKYLIEFGTGCWDYAIETYEQASVVVNMGTDFSIDLFDTLVLPNHDQNCSILSVDWTNEYTFEDEVIETYVYTPPVQEYTPAPIPTYTQEPASAEETADTEQIKVEEDNNENIFDDVSGTENEQVDQESVSEEIYYPNEQEEPPRFKEGLIGRFVSFIKSLF